MKKPSNIPHVRPGDPIRASLFNRMVDALPEPWHMEGPSGFPIYGPYFQAKNIGSEDLEMRDAVSIVGQERETNPQKQTNMFLSVRKAEPGDALDAIAVVIKPIKSGIWGYAQTSGMAWINAEGVESGQRGTLEENKKKLVLGNTGVASVVDVTTVAVDGGDDELIALAHWPVGYATTEAQINWQFVWNEGE